MIRIIYTLLAVLLLVSCGSDNKNPKAADLAGNWKMVEMKDPDITIDFVKNELRANEGAKNAKQKMENMGNKVPDALVGTTISIKDSTLITAIKGVKGQPSTFRLEEKDGKTYMVIMPFDIQRAQVFIEGGKLHLKDESVNAETIMVKQD
ncbi:hypothetical protein AM493_18445 [Flavobacterium akiainvivens]|uniref:Lipocalin-like domain-containing protein n=1 Tax=Flavobacterium akiainvivens TaxID=1202724 RepID=A0A0M8MK27_9FLAO|nr:hypothetical protein [Flavobacterium akiainvivens]KOS07811.1 hypothetical protein AM493_18445 [Flavobacterium akiainvivens]SFQ26842.1 hypothetical protein SAMN05444144_102271 [Flavobacterium akiainvivens]